MIDSDKVVTITKKINYDPSHQGSYGYWVCDFCKASFHGDVESAIHANGCNSLRYEHCTYYYGDAEVKRLKSGLEAFGLTWLHGCFTELQILKEREAIGELEEKLEVYKQALLAVKDRELAIQDFLIMEKFLRPE